MKNLYCYLVIFLLSLSAIYCSDSQNFQGRLSPEARAAQLKERLNLSDEQTKKVEQIYQESSERMSQMRDQYPDDRTQMREQMMRSREEINNQIEEILNQDQIELYRQYLQEEQQNRRGRSGRRGQSQE
jgi:hypothetical protein